MLHVIIVNPVDSVFPYDNTMHVLLIPSGFPMALFSKRSPGVKNRRRRDIPDGLWQKCVGCADMIYKPELTRHLNVCPKCGHHYPLKRQARIDLLLDKDTFQEWDADLVSGDPLPFTGDISYRDKYAENVRQTGWNEAVSTGEGRMEGRAVAVGVMDFSFLGASMGSVVGERITRLFETATLRRLPVVISCASGGARMYEGMLSLMQMAKTSGAVGRHAAAGLAYIAIHTHPTMAGVMASFATLGDVLIAEPGALIGFAGPRVIRETTRAHLPPGFQRAEFLLTHGLLDKVVSRKDLKATVVQLLDYMDGRTES
jgi:acetyl-CoA carboxylase carboxyl transferase subunit beta